MDFEELSKLKIQCFSCPKVYNCKYYQSSIWDWYMFTNPSDGCPAEKYPFESIYFSLMDQKNKKVSRCMR